MNDAQDGFDGCYDYRSDGRSDKPDSYDPSDLLNFDPTGPDYGIDFRLSADCRDSDRSEDITWSPADYPSADEPHPINYSRPTVIEPRPRARMDASPTGGLLYMSQVDSRQLQMSLPVYRHSRQNEGHYRRLAPAPISGCTSADSQGREALSSGK